MTETSIDVAVPWSLSHYIPLNGFHSLYRALFDHAPPGVTLNAWDNIKLHKQLLTDNLTRAEMLTAAKQQKLHPQQAFGTKIEAEYQEYYWQPNQVMTIQLPGDIEFHHTALYPSLTRPFVFHCESFAPIFFPFMQQGGGRMNNPTQVREHYAAILSHPLCLGVFSHISETLDNIRIFFANPEIDRKLFPSEIGLSRRSLDFGDLEPYADLSVTKFLFINSANQNAVNFFRRGGHVVLRFWERFRQAGRQGQLIMRCAQPPQNELEAHGVDAGYVARETGVSIVWIEDYLTEHEMNALLEESHFFLLPSDSLHSVSIMQAMADGVVPVVTDTVGTSHYVSDGDTGIVLTGVKSAFWRIDPESGVLIDEYREKPEVDADMVSQMWGRVIALLDSPSRYYEMRNNAFHHAREHFSGVAFSEGFWRRVIELYETFNADRAIGKPARREIGKKLRGAMIEGKQWERVFESPTQPLRKIYTGQSVVWEMGGAFICVNEGAPSMRLTDWSVFAQYFDANAPVTHFAESVADFGGAFLSKDGSHGWSQRHALVVRLSRLLAPFPGMHGFTAKVLRRSRRYARTLHEFRRYLVFKRTGKIVGTDVELVVEGVDGRFNVVRFFHRYYAFPRDAGPFEANKAVSGGYRYLIYALSLDMVMTRLIREPAGGVSRQDELTLVEEGVHGYNLLRLGNDYYAVPQRLGAVTSDDLRDNLLAGVLRAGSLPKLRSMVEGAVGVSTVNKSGKR